MDNEVRRACILEINPDGSGEITYASPFAENESIRVIYHKEKDKFMFAGAEVINN